MIDVDSLSSKSYMMFAIFPLHAILFNCLRSTQMNYIGSTLCMKLILWEAVVSHYETIFSKFCFEWYGNPAKWEYYGDDYSIKTLSSKDLYKKDRGKHFDRRLLSPFLLSRLSRTHDLVGGHVSNSPTNFSRRNYAPKRQKRSNE